MAETCRHIVQRTNTEGRVVAPEPLRAAIRPSLDWQELILPAESGQVKYSERAGTGKRKLVEKVYCYVDSNEKFYCADK